MTGRVSRIYGAAFCVLCILTVSLYSQETSHPVALPDAARNVVLSDLVEAGFFEAEGGQFDESAWPSPGESLPGTAWKMPARMVALAGAGLPARTGEIGNIPVGRRADRLHFLHTFSAGPKVLDWQHRALAAREDGSKPPARMTVFRYEVTYADGRTVPVNVRWGEGVGGCVREWWNPADGFVHDLAWAQIVWQGKVHPNDRRSFVLYAMEWPNPRPEIEIESLTISTVDPGRQGVGAPLLLGVATSEEQQTGRTCFVSPDGDDGAPGTFDEPWASLHKAAETIRPGDTVYVRGGEYRLTERILFQEIGSEDRWTQIIGYPGETATLNCVDVLWDRSPDRVHKGWEVFPHDVGLLLVHKCSHFRVKNLSLELSRARGFMAEYGDHIEFLYNDTFKTYGTGIRVGRAGGPGYRVIGNTVIRPNCKTMGSDRDDNLGVIRRNPPLEGIDVGTLLDFEIAHNEIAWGDKEAMLIDGSSRNGRIHHNYVHDLYNRPWVSGIAPNGYGNPRNLEISHNIVHDTGIGLGVGTEGGGETRDVRIHHNVLFDVYWAAIQVGTWRGPVRDVEVYNNTIYHCGYLESNRPPAGGICLSGNPSVGGPKNVRVYHNILSGNRDYHISVNRDVGLARDNIRIERNLTDSPVDNTWGTTWVAHEGDFPVQGEPMWVDPENRDFRLRPGSPTVDAGFLSLASRDADGTAPDLGAIPFRRPEVPIPPAGEGFALRVNVGCTESHNDVHGHLWKKDPWRRGGGPYGANAGSMVDRGEVEIAGTDIPEIYRFERYGLGKYTVKVPPGLYRVALHFAETYHREPGRRVFDVFLNGRLILSDLDVFEEAGDRAFAAVVRSAEVKAYEEIEVGFRGHEGAPILNGIEVLQVTEEDLE